MARQNKRLKKVIRPPEDLVIVVAHGQSEVAIAESLRSALRIKLLVIAENRGRSSIQIEGLAKRLDKEPLLKNKAEFMAQYSLSQLDHLHIFTLMDVDDVRHVDTKTAYMTGHIPGIKNRWYKQRVTPIYCDGNLEAVLKLADMPYAKSKAEKTATYLKVFPIVRTPEERQSKRDDFITFRDKTMSLQQTNIDIFVSTCLTIANQRN
ncbi:MAG: hypothetical protein LKJ69_09165 [Lactobacillus sp.]|jgi:hypothetical protein|nr:hypothetical protein [Lactobacillus sp.]MCI2033536.1 hypothetical protein [Lactobacillus sp.]